MTYNIMDEIESINNINHMKNKKKVHSLLDKYGTLENFHQNSTMLEDLEYQFAQGDDIIAEVEQERQIMSSLPKTDSSSLDDTDMAKNASIYRARNRQNTFEDNLFSLPMPSIDNSLLKQYAKNQLTSTRSDASGSKNHVNTTNEIFERVLKRTLREEGGFENRKNMIDTPTNMGIQQVTLSNFKSDYPDIAADYPDNIKNLTYNQAKTIAKLVYFDKYRIGEIKHNSLQELMFDSFFNHSPKAPALWAQRAINKHTTTNVVEDGIFGSKTINALNNLSPEEIIIINNAIVDMRLKDYEREKSSNKNPYYNEYTKGLPNRFNGFRIK